MYTKRLLVVTMAIGMITSQLQSREMYHVAKVWPEAPQGWHFYYPRGVGVDQTGNVYVGDSGNFRIKKFDPEGRLITQWGSPGEGDGQFSRIIRVKVGSSGTVYVLDMDDKGAHSRIQRFTSYGQFTGLFERTAPDADKAELSIGVIESDHGNIFVFAVDYVNRERRIRRAAIEKYSADGKFIAQLEMEAGSGDGQLQMPAAMALDAKDNIYIADLGNNRVQKFDPSGRFLRKWGSRGQGEGEFSLPHSIIVDESGDIYVLDAYGVQKFTPEGEFLTRWKGVSRGSRGIALDSQSNLYMTNWRSHSVLKLDNEGTMISQWGCAGTGDGRFREPGSIAADLSGHIVVADIGNCLIERFTAQGHFVSKWGDQLADPGVSGLATDTSGNLYVAWWGPDEVQKYDPNGKLIGRWGSTGNGDGQFSYAPSIAIGPSGNLFMVDSGNCRVQKFTDDGRFLAKWGTKGHGDGEFDKPFFIAADNLDNIWVGDRLGDGTHRMQKFDTDGRFLAKWTRKIMTPQGIAYFGAMAVDTYGNSYYAFENGIEKYDANGNLISDYCQEAFTEDTLEKVQGMCVDQAGYLYVSGPADPFSRIVNASGSIRKYDPNGKLVSKWAAEDTGRTDNLPNDEITVDGAGNIYVSCLSTVWKLSSRGEFVGEYQCESPLRGGGFAQIGGVALDRFGKVYAVNSIDVDWGDGNPPSIQKFDSNGEFITMWGVPEAAKDRFKYPARIAVDGASNAYVTDQSSHCVHKLDAQGKYIKSWGSKGMGNGQFDMPEGIAADGSGHVYVCDRQNSRIQKFDSDGNFLAKWGKEGSRDGEFHFPAAAAVDQEGNVFVADSDNHRVQKFTADGKFLAKWGDFGEAPGQFNVPLGIAVDDQGNVYVSDSHNHRIQKFAPVASR